MLNSNLKSAFTKNENRHQKHEIGKKTQIFEQLFGFNFLNF